MLHKFISGMLSVFRLGRAQVKNTKNTDLSEVMMVVSNDLRNAYLKLTSSDERK